MFFIYLFVYLIVWMYKYFDVFWYFVETCGKLCFKQTANGHQVSKLWNKTFFSDLPHFPQNFLQIIFTSIYIFHLHITLINVSPQTLFCFSLTLIFFNFNLGNVSTVSGYVTTVSSLKQSKAKKNLKKQQCYQPKK